jgi:hypothetical protein
MPERRLPESLATLLEGLAAEDAAGVLADARTVARARASEVLAEALVERMLDQLAPARSEPSPRRRRQPPQPVPGGTAATAETAVYVYCVVDGSGAADIAVSGIAGDDVDSVAAEGLRALVSTVPLSDFGDEQLKERLNDLEWLEATARAHEAVVEAALAAGPVVPMRLCTIFHDEAGVRAMLAREHRHLKDALERVRGMEELGVKVMADARAAGGDAVRELEAQVAGLPEGERYLARRRLERAAADEGRASRERCAREVHAELAALARDVRVNPPSSRELAGYDGEMVLNAAYLVPTEDAPAFRRLAGELAERHRDRGLRLEVTGPWPPYNFTALAGGV